MRGYSTIIVLFLLLGFFGALSYQEKTPRLVTYRPYPWEDIYSDVYMIISRFIVIGYISVAYPIILATVKS